jgi:hypothetical protein
LKTNSFFEKAIQFFTTLVQNKIMLKKILLIIGFISYSVNVNAQLLQGTEFNILGRIKEDGSVLDENNKVIGHFKKDGMVTGNSSVIIGYIKEDGSVTDESRKIVGYIKQDGTIHDPSNKIIGYIKSDGTVQNQNKEIIGYAKDIPVKWAAVYFFFLF